MKCTFNALVAPKTTESAQHFADVVKKLGGQPELQETNAQMMIERGSQAIGAHTQLRIVEQTRRENRHGSSMCHLLNNGTGQR